MAEGSVVEGGVMTELTDGERIDRHKRFLGANWELLAAFAWEHCQREGRGAVFVREEDFVYAPEPRLTGIRLNYVAEGSNALQQAGGWPGEKESNWVKTYDPDARVVVMVLRVDGGLSGYLIGGPKRPSLAYATRKSQEN